jgi:hypothetical protein
MRWTLNASVAKTWEKSHLPTGLVFGMHYTYKVDDSMILETEPPLSQKQPFKLPPVFG